jgi:hypothetical protein
MITTAIITAAISDATIAYSTDVAPSSDNLKPMKAFLIVVPWIAKALRKDHTIMVVFPQGHK